VYIGGFAYNMKVNAKRGYHALPFVDFFRTRVKLFVSENLMNLVWNG
jgi:hypothetical protein